MIYISDLKDYNSYGLPERFIDCLPEFCPSCGSSLMMSETLTGLQCSNPRCGDKVMMRIKAICQSLGILGFGESTIEKFIETYEVSNPLAIFELQPGMLLGEGVSEVVSEKVISQIKQKDSFLLWEYVQIANLPHIQTSARKIFQDYDNLKDAYEDIEAGGVEFIKKKLDLAGDENGVSPQSIKIYNTLMLYKDDLMEEEDCVHIITLGDKPVLNIVCSDQVGCGFKTKPMFYAYMKEHYGDKVHFNFLTSANKSINYLVWAGADGTPARYTSKVKQVENWNEKGCNIPIVNADMLIKIIEEGVY